MHLLESFGITTFFHNPSEVIFGRQNPKTLPALPNPNDATVAKSSEIRTVYRFLLRAGGALEGKHGNLAQGPARMGLSALYVQMPA